MKIFKIFHPHIQHSVIIQETRTFHGAQRGFALDAHINSIDMPDQEVGVNEKLGDVVAFKTIEKNEAYITFSQGKSINQVFTQLKL
jgi:hypothetical protein